MCLSSLISLGTGLGGLALAGQGAAQNAQAQAKQTEETAIDNELAAAASNNVLGKFLNEQGVNQAANQAALQPVYDAIQPSTFQASQAGIAGTNNAAAQQGITDVLASAGPQLGLTGTDNGQSAAAIQKATNNKVGVARNAAQDYANLAAFGQNFQNLGLTEMNANEKIDTTNNKAKAQAGILPTDEQNAALQARIFIPPADTTNGNTMIGLGGLLSSNAGGIGTAVAGAAPSIGSYFGKLLAPSFTNPTLQNQMTDGSNPGFSVGGA